MIEITEEQKGGWRLSFHANDKTEVSTENQRIKVEMKSKQPGKIGCMEVFAKAAKLLPEWDIAGCTLDITACKDVFGEDFVEEAVLGILMGLYKLPSLKGEENKEEKDYHIYLYTKNGFTEKQKQKIRESSSIGEGIRFARDMVNLPGNKLRPMEFARRITEFVEPLGVEVQLLTLAQLKTLGMKALTGVGTSSEYPPCLLILRYLKGKPGEEIIGYVGKGVTCDTGGYCLKSSASMAGIKGDMAGGAAVAGALYALAKNQKKANVVGCIPICENRISSGCLLPGDVISSYQGKTIEIKNTDAEGRLILADAAAYAVAVEKADKIVDIATLTGAVVNLLGFTVGGAICDNDTLYGDFEKAFERAGERYARIPFYPEHEEMIQSEIADVKNMGESHCGTISAGLFIRSFLGGVPWLHLDIAGTAWVDSPIFAFQHKGATGAGVSTLYHLAVKES